jgi:hypothetical protein
MSALLAGAVGWAQESGTPPAQPMPAPFSRDCQAGSAGVISLSPLPNVAAALHQRKTIKILVIGAAASAGRRGGHGGYTEQIEEILEKAVKGLKVIMINRGVSGELAADAEIRIKNEVALNQPDLVLWQVGTNDALAYVPISTLRATITDTVRWLKAHNVDVVLAGLQFVNIMEQDEHYRAVRELIRRVGVEENVVVVRRSEAMRLIKSTEVGGGGLFPEEFARTEIGYACLAEYVARAITLGAFGAGLRPQSGAPSPQDQPSR